MRFAPVACSNDDICRLINIQNTVLKCYPQVTISCETVDIEKLLIIIILFIGIIMKN